MRKKSGKPKPNVWGNDYRPYGTHDGEYGSTRQWKQAFEQSMNFDEAKTVVRDRSPWSILGVEKYSPFEIVKKAFRELCFKKHPDYGGTNEEFRELNASFTIIKDYYGIS